MFFPRAASTARRSRDITAADGVTHVGGRTSTPFFGTSAAAPHAAAIAGARAARATPGATIADVARGVRRDRAGPRARRASTPAPATACCAPTSVLAYTGATPQPLVQAPAADGDARRPATATRTSKPGETGDAARAGDQRRRRHRDRRQRDASRTGDPQATVTPRSRSYGDLPRGRDTARGLHARARRRATRSASACRLTVRVTFAGVLSPTTATFTVADRPARRRPRSASPTPGPPVPIPDDERARRVGDDPGHRRRLRVQADVLDRRRDVHDHDAVDDRRASTTPSSPT